MATITNRLAFIISANADQAIKGFDKTANAAERQLGKAQNKIDKLGASFTKFGATGMAAAGTLGAGLYKLAQGAIEDQQAQALLAQQLKNTTNATDEQIASVEQLIDVLQRATGISDSELRPAFASLVRSTGSVSKAQKLLGISMDIARGTGKDLSAVVLAVGKAANGQVGAITRLGIPLDAATKKSGDFNKVLEILTKQFGGQAAVYAETYAGKIDRAKVAIDEAKESIGKGFVPIVERASSVVAGGANAFGKLNESTGGAIGSFAGFATVGLGVVSSMSLIAGQTIKMRDNFTDADGKLTKMGATAKYAGIALASIAISETVMTAINEASGSVDKLNTNFQILLATAGKTEKPVGELTHALGKMAEANAEALSMSHLWTDWGKKVQIVGFKVSRPIEDIDKAFKKILQTSPEVAKQTIEDWRKQAAALDHNSQQYKDNIMLIERYTKMLNLQVDATTGLTKAEQDQADADTKAEERKKALAEAAEKLKTKVTSAASALSNKLGSALDLAKSNLQKAQDEFDAYAKSISSAITGTVGFSSAQSAVTTNLAAVQSATDEVKNAQRDYNKAMQEADPEGATDALNRLRIAQDELTKAQAKPKTFIDALKAQESSAVTFAGNIQKLLDLGAKQGLIDQLAASGAEAGNAIATEILSSADPKAYVDQVNGIISSTQSIADQVGKNSAAKFKQAGVDSATNLLAGMNSVLAKAKISLKFSNLNKKGAPIKSLKDLTDQLQNSLTGMFTVAGYGQDSIPQLADGGVVRARTGGTLALLGEGGRDEAVIPLPSANAMGGTTIHVTVQAGVGDPVAIGAALVDVLQKYSARTGSLPLKVR